jgi:hypothetical protein
MSHKLRKAFLLDFGGIQGANDLANKLDYLSSTATTLAADRSGIAIWFDPDSALS